MKWFTVKEGILFKLDEVLTKNHQIAISAWKQGNKIDKGTWSVFLASPPDFNQQVGEFEYDGYEDPGWNEIPMEWVDIDKDVILEFTLFLRPKNLRKGTGITLNSFPENWMYKIYVKTKEESGEGIRNPKEFIPTINYCTKTIKTEGADKVLGAKCRIDPYTNKPMDTCLNWRRADQVGTYCYNMLKPEIRKETIKEFCSKDKNREDCKCVNRLYNQEYQKLSTLNKDDYCWYPPCKSGAYLLDREGETITCYPSNDCVITYNADHVGGDVNFNENTSVIRCHEMESIPPTFEQNTYKKFIVILLILLVLFILFK